MGDDHQLLFTIARHHALTWMHDNLHNLRIVFIAVRHALRDPPAQQPVRRRVLFNPLPAAMRDFGMHLGIAFQLIDDQLDYQGETGELGKNVGDDLAEGKVTLPLIVAMRNGNESQRTTVREAIRTGGTEHLQEIISIVRETGGLDYTSDLAERERDLALACLEQTEASVYRDAMASLIRFVVDRRS